jgi:hypothetical protein
MSRFGRGVWKPMTNKSNLISRIQSSAGGSLVGWQFAVDGKWDAAERILLDDCSEQLTNARIGQWLARHTTDNVAFESLFESNNSERFFFGVRITHLEAKKKIDVLKKLITTSKKAESIESVVQSVRDCLDDQRLATAGPEYLELGVFDLWNRVKSLVVWKKGESLGVKSELVLPGEIPNRTQKPDDGFAPLHEPQTKPLMLEAAWARAPDNGNHFQCWISLPVSKHEINPDRYSLSEDRYLFAAATLIGHIPA